MRRPKKLIAPNIQELITISKSMKLHTTLHSISLLLTDLLWSVHYILKHEEPIVISWIMQLSTLSHLSYHRNANYISMVIIIITTSRMIMIHLSIPDMEKPKMVQQPISFLFQTLCINHSLSRMALTGTTSKCHIRTGMTSGRERTKKERENMNSKSSRKQN